MTWINFSFHWKYKDIWSIAFLSRMRLNGALIMSIENILALKRQAMTAATSKIILIFLPYVKWSELNTYQRLSIGFQNIATFYLSNIGNWCSYAISYNLAGKLMMTMFWDVEGSRFVHFILEGKRVNTVGYCDLLKPKIERRGKLLKGVILFRDNTRPHTVTEQPSVFSWSLFWTASSTHRIVLTVCNQATLLFLAHWKRSCGDNIPSFD